MNVSLNIPLEFNLTREAGDREQGTGGRGQEDKTRGTRENN